MTESEQWGLDEFESPDEGRPDEEAAVVAGDGGQSVSEIVDTADLKFPDSEGVVEMKVSQVDYTVEGSGAEEYPVIHVFGRTAENEPEHVRVLGVEPYFYVPTENVADRALTEEYDAILDTRTEDPNGDGFESIRGKPLTKVIGRTPRDVGQMRDDFEEHYEADILFPNRFLIDKDVSAGLQVPERRLDDGRIQVRYDDEQLVAVDAPTEADLRVNTFDIEVDDRSGFPEDGEEPIVCLTSHDSYDDEYVVWLFDAPDAEVPAPEALEEYEQIADSGSVDVRVFDEEPAMLDAFVEYIEDGTNPDVLTGWNCLPGDSEILLTDGRRKPIADIEVGDEVVGSNEQSTTGTTVTNKWESEKTLLQFDLADGTSLRSSEEHRIMVGDDESVDWKEAGDIEDGDFVVKPRKLNVEEPAVPTFEELVPLENQRFRNRETVQQFKQSLPHGAVSDLSDSFGVSKEVLYQPDTSVWTPTRCRQAAERFDIPVADGGTEYRRSGQPLDEELSPNDLYLAGLVMSDGSMSRDDGIRFYNTRTELHEQFPGAGDLTPDGKGCFKQNVLDYATMHAFNGLGIPFGDKNNEDIDLSTVFELPEEYIARFLAGAIDGDGSIGTTVTLAAENPSLGEWYERLFNRIGVYAERRDNIVRVPDSEREISVIRERVAPYMSHSEKTQKLSEISGGKSGRSENIPYALFEAETGSDEKRIGRDKHRRGINLKRHETTVDEWDEYVFVEVRSVERTGTETTYDIETGTHNFIADGSLVHNCDDFDMPYVLDRLEAVDPTTEYDLDVDRLSRVDEVWRSDWGGPDVKGRVVFDLLYGYKQIVIKELESFRLDAIGERELDVGKEHYSGDIGDLWEQDPEQLLEYNLRDVELCVEIDRKQSVVAFWDEVRSFVGCKLEDAPTAGDAVDMYVLHKAYGEFGLPSKGQQEAAEEFEGGAVFEPISGVKENVTVLDLKSLYPMSMATINSSPETKVDPDEYDGETYHAPDGTHFRKEPDGIMREMIDELLTEREEKKELRDQHDPDSEAYERYDRQQGGVKVIMNSLYGVSGWDRFRLYDTEGAAAVTATGREVIEFTETASEEIGHEVAYGDSVTGDRPVVVRDPDGSVRVLPIETLFERAEETAAGEIRITADGGTVASATPGKSRRELPGWEALSVNENGESEWQPITRAIRHETDKPVVTLQHKFGESTTTRDHSYVVEDGDELVEAVPEDVDEPLRVPGLPAVDEQRSVDVYEVLDGYSRTYEDGRSVGAENAEEKVKRVHTDGEHVWFGHEHHGELDSTPKVQRHVDLDSEDGRALVRLLAAYVTEGSASTEETTDSRFGASIAESRPEWLAGLREDYERLFENVTASVIGSDTNDERTVEYETTDGESSATYDDGTQKLQMMNELAAVFFREFAGQRSRGKRVPSFVYHLPDDLQSLFLDTLVEGDGSREFPRYSDEYAERNFDYETVSRELAAGLSTLLTQRGKKHSLKYRDAKGSYTIRTCEFYRNGQDPVVEEVDHDGYVYDLSVAENENFVDGVGGVVLHNTDSVMLSLGGDISKEDAIEQSFGIEEHINERYDDFARDELNAETHRFQIEFEKLYRRFFQAGKKKRYAGHIVWKEGKDVDDIDITGFEYKRSDIAPVTKRVQHEVIDMIVRGDDLDDVQEYLHDEITTFEEGEADLDEVGIPGGIGKRLDAYDTDTAQVRGAKYANLLLGTNFQRGSKPKRLYLKKVHPEFWQRMENERGFDPQTDPLYREFKRDPDVICFEYAEEVPAEFEVDWPKMLDKTLKGPIERVIEALGLSWDEVKSGQEQTGLGQWG